MYIEVPLVQKAAAEHLKQLLGWACNNEEFEQDRLPG